MSNTYDGDASGIDEDTAVAITSVAAGDNVSAANVVAAPQKLADLVEYLRANTVKRSQGALGASKPNGQRGPIPLDISVTEAFDFRGGGVDAFANPVAKFFSETGGAMDDDARIYYQTSGDIIITRGCLGGGTLDGVAQWQRSGTRTGVAYKYTFGIAGLKVESKNAGGAGDRWGDDAWDKSITLDVAAGVQGDVLGYLAANTVGFGRPKEASTALVAGAGFAADGTYPPVAYRDAMGSARLKGRFNSTGGSFVGASFVFGSIPAGSPIIPALQVNAPGVLFSTGFTNHEYEPCTIQIGGDGSLNIERTDNALVSANCSIILDGTTYVP